MIGSWRLIVVILHAACSATVSLVQILILASDAAAKVRRRLRESDTAKAGGLALATLINNAVQLAFTIVFTRLLGLNNYGSLAALVSAFLIMLVGGQAIQVAAAREVARGRLGDLGEMGRSVRSWVRSLIVATVVALVAGALLRVPLASLIGVPDHSWGAAALPATGTLWLLLSLQRGILQGLHAYKPVGLSIIAEAVARLVGALILVAAGTGVTGVFIATPLSLIAVSLGLARVLRGRIGSDRLPVGAGVLPAAAVSTLRGLVVGGWGPIFGLTLLALLQNVDVIVVRHQWHGNRAGSYAAAAVAAKAVVWVAIGVGLHLLPEATRRAQAGLDPRPVLMRALAVLAVIAAPALLIFATVPHLLLSVAFGAKATQASGALILLGGAMTLLAVSYLTVQYMLALGNVSFLWALGAVALVEPFLLSAGSFSLVTFAAVVLGLQVVSAAAVLTLGLRARAVGRVRVAESMA